MAEKWRLFIAVELPPPVVGYLNEIQQWLRLRAPRDVVRWVKAENIHLTLKFLGDTSSDYTKSLREVLAEAVAEYAPFELAAGGMGCFPSSHRPRVAWVGVHHDLETLHALRDAVEAHIAPLGYPTEDRPFHPHLTLGRVRRDASRTDTQQLGDLLQENRFTDHRRWRVEQVTLFRSELTPKGAVYTPLYHAPLRSNE